MKIDVWLGFPAEARPDGVCLPEISMGLVFQARYCLRYDVTPAHSLMFRCTALNVMLCAFTMLIVGHVRGLCLMVGPVSTAVCALGAVVWFVTRSPLACVHLAACYLSFHLLCVSYFIPVV